MDATDIIRPKLSAKVWDLVYGILLLGAAPLFTCWALGSLLDWPSNLVFQHYGERVAFHYQLITGLIAFLAAIPAFGLAIWWRVRHRVLPLGMLALEIAVAVIGAFFVVAYMALLYGPNDAWNR